MGSFRMVQLFLLSNARLLRILFNNYQLLEYKLQSAVKVPIMPKVFRHSPFSNDSCVVNRFNSVFRKTSK